MKANIIPVWKGTVEGGKIRLRNPKDFAAYVAKLEGLPIDLVCRKEKDTRSLKQNAYYHGVLVEMIAEEMGLDHDLTHHFLKDKFNAIIVNILGKEVRVARSTAQLSRIRFTDFIESIRVWAASQLNLNIPDPNEVVIDYEWGGEK